MMMYRNLNMISALLLTFIVSAVNSFPDTKLIGLDELPEAMELENSDLLIPEMKEEDQGRYEVIVTALNNPTKETGRSAVQKIAFLKKLVRQQKALESERYDVLVAARNNPELQKPKMADLLTSFQRMDSSFVRKRQAVEDFLRALDKKKPFDAILNRCRLLQSKILDRLPTIYLKKGPDPEDLEEKYHITPVLRLFLLSLVKNIQIQHELNLW